MPNSRRPFSPFDPWIILWAADQWKLEQEQEDRQGLLLPPPQYERPQAAGRRPEATGRLADAMGVDHRTLKRNALDRVQTVDSWLLRMRQIEAGRRKPAATVASKKAERKQA